MLYLLKQKSTNRLKIGISDVPKNRIAQLERIWGKFDEDSLVLELKGTENKKDYKTEKSFHRSFEQYKIHDLPNKDGYTEFFNLECYSMVEGLALYKTNKIHNINDIMLKETVNDTIVKRQNKKISKKQKDEFDQIYNSIKIRLGEEDTVFVKPKNFNLHFNQKHISLLLEGEIILKDFPITSPFSRQDMMTKNGNEILISGSTNYKVGDELGNAHFHIGCQVKQVYNKYQINAIIEDLFNPDIHKLVFNKNIEYRESKRELLFETVKDYKKYCILTLNDTPEEILKGSTTIKEVEYKVNAYNNINIDQKIVFSSYSKEIDDNLVINNIPVYKFVKKITCGYYQFSMTEEIVDYFNEVKKIHKQKNGKVMRHFLFDNLKDETFEELISYSIDEHCSYEQLGYDYIGKFKRMNDSAKRVLIEFLIVCWIQYEMGDGSYLKIISNFIEYMYESSTGKVRIFSHSTCHNSSFETLTNVEGEYDSYDKCIVGLITWGGILKKMYIGKSIYVNFEDVTNNEEYHAVYEKMTKKELKEYFKNKGTKDNVTYKINYSIKTESFDEKMIALNQMGELNEYFKVT